VTLTTVPADRFWNTVSPAEVHRGVAALAAPRVSDEKATDAAAPKTPLAAPMRTSPMIRHHMCSVHRQLAKSPAAVWPPVPSRVSYPLMTTLMPVIEAAESDENVAAKLVPDEGVVPVASPSEALAAVDRVTL
jgi:hypothetical protein